MWTKVLVWISRLRGTWPWSKRRLDADLRREIDKHLELLEEEYRQRGRSPREARRAARMQFGGVAQLEDTVREQRSFVLVDALLQDIRFGGRMHNGLWNCA